MAARTELPHANHAREIADNYYSETERLLENIANVVLEHVKSGQYSCSIDLRITCKETRKLIADIIRAKKYNVHLTQDGFMNISWERRNRSE